MFKSFINYAMIPNFIPFVQNKKATVGVYKERAFLYILVQYLNQVYLIHAQVLHNKHMCVDSSRTHTLRCIEDLVYIMDKHA